MAEATLAPVEETPTLVTQDSPPVDDATPPGDAGQQASSDAAPVVEESVDLEAEADAYLKELEGKGSDRQAPEPTQAQGVDPAVAQRDIAIYRQNHALRQEEIKARKDELVSLGVEPALAERMAKEDSDRLNSHHADGLRYAGSEAAMRERAMLVQAITDVVPQAIQTKVLQSLKPADGQPNPPIGKVLEAFITEIKATAKAEGEREGRRAGFIDGNKHYDSKKSSARSGQSVQGDPASGTRLYSQMSAEERGKLTPEQRDAAVARERQARGG